jgi:hypothetical protein
MKYGWQLKSKIHGTTEKGQASTDTQSTQIITGSAQTRLSLHKAGRVQIHRAPKSSLAQHCSAQTWLSLHNVGRVQIRRAPKSSLAQHRPGCHCTRQGEYRYAEHPNRHLLSTDPAVTAQGRASTDTQSTQIITRSAPTRKMPG